jgi:hypothetical protein
MENGSAQVYEQVNNKIKSKDNLSESFNSDVGVKQGCPFSPTALFSFIRTS